MPYVSQFGVETPPDNTVIWRYLDLPKLLLLIEQGSLYFALTKELEDEWEAVLSRKVRAKIAYFAPSASGTIVHSFQEFCKHVGINCWHIDESESIAMWSLYTSWKPSTEANCYGTAIKSDVGRLKSGFERSQEKIVIGEVLYADHSNDFWDQSPLDGTNAFEPIYQKRTCFRHEKELRAATVIVPESHSGYPVQGRSIQVNLDLLIDSIVLCPNFPAWSRDLIESAASRANIKLEIIESEILLLPSARGFD
jgi:hypothetical protein